MLKNIMDFIPTKVRPTASNGRGEAGIVHL